MQFRKKNWSIALGVAAVGLTALAPSVSRATVLADWNFQSDAVAVNNTPAADIGTGTASSIGMNIYPTPNVGVTTDDILVGKASDTGLNGVADTTQEWRVRGQAAPGGGAANGWSSLAPIGTQGAIFASSTAGVSGPINVSFDWYSTTQGEANLQLEYTTNGINWIIIPISLSGSDAGLVPMTNSGSDVNTVTGSYVSDNILNPGVSATAGQDWFTDLTATVTDPNASNDPSFAIEMVNASMGADCVSTQGTALNNNSGNWRFDNVVISSVPEPASVSLLALAGLGLLSCRRSAK